MSRNTNPSLDLIVGATPQQHLVYTNHVYLADDAANASLLMKRPGQTETYVIVNERYVYVARAHKSVAVGDIGLSSIQRETCQVSSGQNVRVAYWEQPVDGRADLVTLKLDLELIGSKRCTVAAAELAPVLVRNFVGQVFGTGQIFCCDFQGTALKFRVEYGEAGVPVSEQNKTLRAAQRRAGEQMTATHTGEWSEDDEDEGAITKQVDRGVLNASTRVELTAQPSRFLTFKPEEQKKPSMLNPKFKFSNMGIGGLDAEFGMIFRRSFASRLFPVETTRKLGIKHVKGMLLYGPPGTGKTLIARQIGKVLATKEPKVVNGPEILNKFVGASEENIRNLFKEAEEDQLANGDNAELHIIIFDEIDAVRGREMKRHAGHLCRVCVCEAHTPFPCSSPLPSPACCSSSPDLQGSWSRRRLDRCARHDRQPAALEDRWCQRAQQYPRHRNDQPKGRSTMVHTTCACGCIGVGQMHPQRASSSIVSSSLCVSRAPSSSPLFRT